MLKSAVGSALLVAATHSVALSLGGTQGGVIIGRPLDVLVQSSVEASEAASGLCLEAEVLYGDMRVSPTAVTVAIHRLGANGAGALRVRSTQPVNEPIVTLILKAGCESRYTRNYALLADYEPAPVTRVQEAPVARPAAPAPVQPAGSGTVKSTPATERAQSAAATSRPAPAPAAVPWTLAAPAPRPAGVMRLASKARPGENHTLAKAPGADAPSGTQVPVAAAPAPAAPKTAVAAAVTPEPKQQVAPEPPAPRLKLEPVDMPSAVPGTGSPVVEGAATTDPAAPDPKVTALEQELQGMRGEQAKLRAAIESVNAQLAQAQTDRYSSSVVYVLLGLLVALLAALLVVLRRRPDPLPIDSGPVPTWWNQATSEDALQSVPTPAADSGKAELTDFADLDAMQGLEVREPVGSTVIGAPVHTPPNLDALLDLMQQVEFFESLGQNADAVSTLASFTQAFPGMSELPYLLWQHRALELGDSEAVNTAQRQYQIDYGRLPPSFGVVSPGLDTDKVFMEQLCEVWPTLGARNLIEMSLWSQPGDPLTYWQVRTPTAARDLLLLLGMLDVIEQQGTVSLTTADADEPYALRNEKGASGWLDLDLTDPVSVARVEPFETVRTPAAAPEPEPTVRSDLPTERPPLDFEFLDFKTPQKPGDGKS